MSRPTAGAVQVEEPTISQDYSDGILFNHDFKLRVTNWKQPAKSTATSGTSRSPSPVISSQAPITMLAPSQPRAAGQLLPIQQQNVASRTMTTLNGGDSTSGMMRAERMPPQLPSTPAGRFARSLRGGSARSPSRPSSLRNSFSARDQENHEAEAQAPSAEYAESETDESVVESGCETDDASDYEDEDDNDWSGENDNLESLVISAVGLDYSLAAHLIPLIHRDFNGSLKSKVESWRCATAHGSGETSAGGEPSSTNTSPTQGSGTSRKRRRANSSGDARDDGGWDEDDDCDDQKDRDNFGNMGPPTSPSGARDSPLLACPFHKRDPIKYSMHRESGTLKKHKYRPCTGPGFKSIQRLKEHLRRTHSPVQCERCKETFHPSKGGDRAESLNKLAEHRKSETSCLLRDASLKEGVDEVQWAKLDKQNRRKNAEVHRVEKWFEIWDVLFPGVPRPDSPWHEMPAPLNRIPKDGEDQFTSLFMNILDHKINVGDIPLPDPSVEGGLEILRDRLKTVVQNTFRMYVNIGEKFFSDTSSSQSNPHPQSSFLGGSGGIGGGGGSSTQRSGTVSLQRTTTTAPTSIGSGPNRGAAPQNPAAAATPSTSAYTLASAYAPISQQYLPAQFPTLAEHDPSANHTFYFAAGNHPNIYAPQPGYWVPTGTPAGMPSFTPAHMQAAHAPPHQTAPVPEPWYNYGDPTTVAQGGFVGGHHHGDFGHGTGEDG